MELHSNSFKAGGVIPDVYTCHGDNISPPLNWSGAPEDTQSYALIVEDPDAPKGIYTHWVVYNIPSDRNGIPEGIGDRDGMLQGKNDFGKPGYGGPCPPPGRDHRYFFHLFALDSKLEVPPGATKVEVENAMKNHIIDHAQIMGRYGR